MAYYGDKITLDTLFTDIKFKDFINLKNSVSNVPFGKKEGLANLKDPVWDIPIGERGDFVKERIVKNFSSFINLAIIDINKLLDYKHSKEILINTDLDNVVKVIFATIDCKIDKFEVAKAIANMGDKIHKKTERKREYKEPFYKKVSDITYKRTEPDENGLFRRIIIPTFEQDSFNAQVNLLSSYFKVRYNDKIGLKENMLNFLNCNKSKLKQIVKLSKQIVDIRGTIITKENQDKYSNFENTYKKNATIKPYAIQKATKDKIKRALTGINNSYKLGLSTHIKDNTIINAIEKDLNKILLDKKSGENISKI
ncbi:hypothetical protein HHI31_00140 [Campylobacter fetus subsp. venerealis]|uniref:hypothetical protein n=1 Tax=Campylobacter fetus TaxID=196 RepID=UPI0018E7E3F9|nr:hypothetical protein [Campylobacter fetus]QQF51324.1 hypothetical protein HHI31_00140 [Campylobacter fetus subsp. venerealis]